MNKYASAILLGLFITLFCFPQNKYNISVKLPNRSFSGKKAFVFGFGNRISDLNILDSTVIKGDTFSLEDKNTEKPYVALLRIEDFAAIPIVMENKNIEINFKSDSDYRISNNCGMNKNLKIFMDSLDYLSEKAKPFIDELDDAKLKRALNREEKKTLSLTVDSLEKVFSETEFNFLKKNIDNPIGKFFFIQMNMGNTLPAEKQLELIGKLPEEMKNSFEFTNRKEELEREARTSAGKPYIDIKGKSADGQEKSISGEMGKYNLCAIFILASSCRPALRDIHPLKRLYRKYKDSGFGILSFSLDSVQGKWDRYRKIYGIPWTDFSDRKGWNSPVVKDYTIRSLPCILLLDKNGTIIAKNITIENLKEELETIFPEPDQKLKTKHHYVYKKRPSKKYRRIHKRR